MAYQLVISVVFSCSISDGRKIVSDSRISQRRWSFY